jgi:hypothetical protein
MHLEGTFREGGIHPIIDWEVEEVAFVTIPALPHIPFPIPDQPNSSHRTQNALGSLKASMRPVLGWYR